MTALTYRQLPSGRRAIRTLRLLPGRWMDGITCELQEACLDDQPAFDALSYVWGNAKDTTTITVNGYSFEATKNLVAALRRLRSSIEAKILWVDAICINQNDNQEKTQQVQLMADIYQYAHTVNIFLGESGVLDFIPPEEQASWDDPPSVWWHHDPISLLFTGQPPSKSTINSEGVLTDPADILRSLPGMESYDPADEREFAEWAILDPLDGLNQNDQKMVDEFFARQQHGTADDITQDPLQVLRNNQAGAFAIMKMLSNGRCLKSCLHSETRLPAWSGAFEVIDHIIHLPWWNRMWVLQEAVLPAGEVRAIYGEINAPMALIEGAGGILRRHHTKGVCCKSFWESLPFEQTQILSKFEAKMEPLAQIREIVLGPVVQDQIDLLFIIMEITRFKEATDPHDRIYGLLGLLSESPNPIDLKPDYDVPVDDLFTQLAFRFLTHYGTFHKIINHELPLPQDSPLFYLPSWVPHWGHTYGTLTRDLLVQRINSYTAWPSCAGPLPDLVTPVALEVRTRPLSRVIATTPIFDKSEIAESGEPLSNYITAILMFFLLELGTRDASAPYRPGERSRPTTLSATQTSALAEAHEKESEEASETIFSAFSSTIFGDLRATSDHILKASNISFSHFGNPEEAQKAALTLLGDNASEATKLGVPARTPPRDSPVMSLEEAERNFWYANDGRLFFVTEDGYIGSGPPLMKVGHEVVLVMGSPVPFVLWRTPVEGIPENQNCWMYAGYAYMHGVMDGEAAPVTWFNVERGYLF